MIKRIADSGFHIFGQILQFGCGLILWAFWFGTMREWLGPFLGSVVGLLLTPGAIIFPFLYWIIEGVFIWYYFAFWGLSIVGVIISALSD